MSRDNEDFDVYDKTDELEEADEIDEVEAGFMKGYEEDVDESICSNCRKVIKDTDFIEEDIDGKTFRFCSKECANKYELRKEHL